MSETFDEWKLRVRGWTDKHHAKASVSIYINCECPNCGAKISMNGMGKTKLEYHNVTRPEQEE